MLRDGAIHVQWRDAKIIVAAIATVIGAARRKDGNGRSTIVVAPRRVASVLATGVDGLYNGLGVGTVIRPNGSSDAGGW